MSAPLPVNLSVAAAPLGWKDKLPGFFTLFKQSLYAELDQTFLIGQSGGSMPLHDIGPWFNDTPNQQGWYFFDPISGQYQPAQQGCPVGTIAMWGGSFASLSNYAPRWLQCYGQPVSRRTYSTLFNAIGETWGAGDGTTTFNLPPGGVFYINAAGFVADFRVPLSATPQVAGQPTTEGVSPTGPPQGVGARGGGQLSGLLQPSDMPAMTVTLRTAVSNFNTGSPSLGPGTPIPNIQPEGTLGGLPSFQDEYLSDMAGNLLGKNQVGFPMMPPFVAIYYIIKWQ